MMEQRHELRYKIMTILYQIELYKNNDIRYNVDEIINEHVKEESKFVNTMVLGICEKEKELDKIANSYLESWNIDRLGYTDGAILRMGIYELLYMDTAPLISIDTAIELAKKYSDDKVTKMINGVLDKVYHHREQNGE